MPLKITKCIGGKKVLNKCFCPKGTKLNGDECKNQLNVKEVF